MKKYLISALLCLACLSAGAQDSEQILKKIAASASRSLDCPFTEVRHRPGKEPATLNGRLVFKPSDFLSMDYVQNEYFEINGDNLIIRRNETNLEFDTSKNLLMRGLSHILLYSFQGNLEKFTQENKTTVISAAQEGKDYVVTVKDTKKGVKGYCEVVVRYNVSDCAIKNMRMDEFGGASTYYELN